MNNSYVFRHAVWTMLGIVVLLTLGCSLKSTVVSPKADVMPSLIVVESVDSFQWPDGNLQIRFQQYWTNRKAGNAVAAFEFEAPHIKEMVIWGKYERFSKTVRTDWLSIQVQKINRITDQLIEIDFDMIAKSKDRVGTKRKIFFRDSWLLLSGEWFHVLKDPIVTGDGLGK